MRDEIELLRDARPDTVGPSREVSAARAALFADIAGAHLPRWRRRRLFGLAAPAVAAAVVAIVLGITLSSRSDGQAWAAALVRVAEAAPRLLVDEPAGR